MAATIPFTAATVAFTAATIAFAATFANFTVTLAAALTACIALRDPFAVAFVAFTVPLTAFLEVCNAVLVRAVNRFTFTDLTFILRFLKFRIFFPVCRIPHLPKRSAPKTAALAAVLSVFCT